MMDWDKIWAFNKKVTNYSIFAWLFNVSILEFMWSLPVYVISCSTCLSFIYSPLGH